MTKTLDTLIKLHKREVDEKRKELAKEQKFRDEVLELLNKHQQQKRDESKFAGQNSQSILTYDKYINLANLREDKIISVLYQQDEKIEKLSDEIFAGFSELKRYEILKDKLIDAAEKKEARLEQQFLDEIALNNTRD